MKTWVGFLSVLCCGGMGLAAEKTPQPDAKVTYVKRGEKALQLHTFRPADWKAGDARPAVVFYFGGGWVGGSPGQFYRHCRVLADRGMVAMAAEYRVKSRDKTTPFDCLQDAKAALRYVQDHAQDLGIDPKRVAAGGGSAGGHLAAATAFVEGWDEPGAKTPFVKPVALALFNPVIDNSPTGWGNKAVGKEWKRFSPLHNIRKDAPPAVFFLGTEDKLIPVSVGERFEAAMKTAGSPNVRVFTYDGAGHGFFNKSPHYEETVEKMVAFFETLGWLGR